MHTSKDDYLISTLRFVSVNESTQICGDILLECLTNPAMKESKAYNTYPGYATGVVPLKIARKFKKTSPSKKVSDLVPVDEEPVTKGKRVKRSVKKSLTKPATGIIIKEPLVENKSKRKEKVDVTHGKGIELLSKVALIEEAQMKEVRKKSLRYFYKLHLSGSGTTAEKPPRVDKITPTVTSEGAGHKPEVLDVTKMNQLRVNQNLREMMKMTAMMIMTQKMKAMTIRMKVMMIKLLSTVKKEKENLKITQEQVIEDAHVTIMTIAKETKVHVASVSHSSNLASKFLNFSDIHPNDAEIISPLDVHVHHEVPRIYTSTLLTVPVSVIPEASHLPQILPEEVSKFAMQVIEESLNQVNLEKESSQPQSTYEAAATLTEFELKKILIDKMNTSESYMTAPEHQECYDGLIKSYNLNKDFFSSYDVYSLKRSRQDEDTDEGPSAGTYRGFKNRKTSKDAEPTTEFEIGDTDTPQGQEGNLGYDDVEPRKESASRRDWFTKPSRPQEPTDPDWNEDKTP
nr:hypothetical protein [Tanacetum cinerariifolium]